MLKWYCSLSDAEAQFDGGRSILYLYNLNTCTIKEDRFSQRRKKIFINSELDVFWNSHKEIQFIKDI